MCTSKQTTRILASILPTLFFVATLFGQASPQQPADPFQAVPSDSLFVIRVNTFEYTLGQIDQYLAGVSPVPMGLRMLVRAQLAGLTGNGELPGLNMNGTFAVFAVADQKNQGQPKSIPQVHFGALIPVTDYNTFVGNNPNITKPDANGVSSVTAGMPAGAGESMPTRKGPKLWLKQHGSYALVTAKPGDDKILLQRATAGSLAKTLSAGQMTEAAKSPIWTYGNVQVASKAFGPFLLDKLENFEPLMKGIEQSQKIGAGQEKQSNEAAQMQKMLPNVMRMYAALLKTLMDQTESVSIGTWPTPEVLNISETITALPKTDMADILTAQTSSSRLSDLAGYLEDGAVMNFAVRMDAARLKRLNEKGIELLQEMGGNLMSADDIAKMKAIAAENADALEGPAAVSVLLDPLSKPPFVARYVVAVRDPENFNKAALDATSLFGKGWLREFYKGFGIQTEFAVNNNADSYKGIAISSAKLTLKSTEPNSPVGQMIDTMYAGGFEYRWAIVNGLCAMVVGGQPEKTVREMIDRLQAGTPKQISAEVKAAMSMLPDADKADFLVTYNYVRLFKMMAGMMRAVPGAGLMMPQIDVPTSSNINIAGRFGDGKLRVDVAVPKQHLAEIVSIFTTMQRQMQNQQKPSLPAPGKG